MFDFHHQRHHYFEIQYNNSRNSVLPFINTYFKLPPGASVLEVGCGEGGVLKAFTDEGYYATGIEIDKERVSLGERLMEKEVKAGRMRFVFDDIFTVLPPPANKQYHLILLKDVIEHLPNKAILFRQLKQFLRPGGMIFFGFPPWQMPFGGHQQMCSHRFLSRSPWLHLLPRFLYRQILAKYQQPVDALMDIHATRISIEGFEKLIKKEKYRVLANRHFLIAPIYQYKFGLKERKQLWPIRHLPYFRNLVTTAVYYLVTPLENDQIMKDNQNNIH